MKTLELIEALSNANGISGFETDVISAAKPFISEDVAVFVDVMNNCFLTPHKNDMNKPLILLDGHLDELGLMVQAITATGLLRVIAIGSWDIKNLLAQKMRLVTEDGTVIKGVVASKPVHFMKEGEAGKIPVIEDILVDVGCLTREEAVGLGIRIGMALVPDVTFENLPAQQVMIGKAFDNRLGCCLVIDTVNSAIQLPAHHVLGVMSTQEEIGGRGAAVAGNMKQADLAIIFEGSPADDTFVSLDEAQGVIGHGVQIRHADRTMISHPGLTALAVRLAKENGITFQETVRRGGGTNGAVYHTKGKGIPCVVLGIPVRYVHAHYGIAKESDYHSAKALALAIISYVTENGLTF